MIITVFLIRHGLSCCNILHHDQIKYLAYANTFRQDPYLTEIGKKQSTRGSKYIENKLPPIDIVLSSPLIRAIETALYMFPENEIDVTPYICESNKSLENRPLSVKKQK